MQSILKPLLLSLALASAGVVAIAQSPATATTPTSGAHEHGRMDPAKMQQRRVARMAELKSKLNLNDAQEAAWTSYVAAMQPPAHMGMTKDRENRQKTHEEWKTLTTPQRIDRMTAMQAERATQMRRRTDATLAFYIALSPEQQQAFDANTTRMGGMKGHHGARSRNHGDRHHQHG